VGWFHSAGYFVTVQIGFAYAAVDETPNGWEQFGYGITYVEIDSSTEEWPGQQAGEYRVDLSSLGQSTVSLTRSARSSRMHLIKQNTLEGVRVFMRSTDTGSGLSGIAVSMVVQIAKAGASSFSTITPVITDVGSGLYNLALTQSHTDTLGVVSFHVTAPNAIDNDELEIEITAFDPKIGTNLALTALPTANAGANTGLPVVGSQVPNASAGAIGGLPLIGAQVPNASAGAIGGLPLIGVQIPNAVAGVSLGLATKQNVDDAAVAVVASIPSAAVIRDAILNELLSAHSVVGSVADGIAIAMGLLQGNFFMDQTDNTGPNGQTAARLRLWRSAAAMVGVTDGGTGEGEFAAFQVTTVYVSPNKVATHKVLRTHYGRACGCAFFPYSTAQLTCFRCRCSAYASDDCYSDRR
jgi:hypothetical protein